MALAQIIDLDKRRRARQTSLSSESVAASMAVPTPAWCYVWMPIYFWYVT